MRTFRLIGKQRLRHGGDGAAIGAFSGAAVFARNVAPPKRMLQCSRGGLILLLLL